jgi:hypothetical protein
MSKKVGMQARSEEAVHEVWDKVKKAPKEYTASAIPVQ